MMSGYGSHGTIDDLSIDCGTIAIVWGEDDTLDGLAIIVVHASEGELVLLASAVLLRHNRREAC